MLSPREKQEGIHKEKIRIAQERKAPTLPKKLLSGDTYSTIPYSIICI